MYEVGKVKKKKKSILTAFFSFLFQVINGRFYSQNKSWALKWKTMCFFFVYLFNVVTVLYLSRFFEMYRLNCLAPMFTIKCFMLTWGDLHLQTPISWTLSLCTPFEGHVIIEVGNFNWQCKDESTYSPSERAQELHTALEYS